MKKRLRLYIQKNHPAAVIACCLMLFSSIIRLWHYLNGTADAFTVAVHILLPVSAAVLFILGILLGGKWWVPFSEGAVVLGIVFFIVKAAVGFAPLHRTLCTLLYITVLTVYTLTVFGYLPTHKLLYPLFGLPFLYHLLVEDTRLYFFAYPPSHVWFWMPEISVLCIMAALFFQTAAIRTEKL